MTLYTERLILRPWEDADAESLYQYAKDPAVGPAAGWPPHTSAENSRAVIQNVLSAPETYAVCLKEDNRAIGSIGLMIGGESHLALPDTEGEIGYWIGVPFWGRGLIPEAVRELLRHAFGDLRLETVWCGYFDGNVKSRRVQEKCGFVYHHMEKDVYWKLTDDIRTEHFTRLTREEWQRIAETANVAYSVVKLSERRDLREAAARWFAAKWNVPIEAYRESIEASFAAAVPSWYLCLDGERIAGGMGVIENDFHDRRDLSPNVCAVCTEPEYRGRGIAGKLLNFVCEDMHAHGIDTLYLLTDHTGFYERYGWEYLCHATSEGEQVPSRMYVHKWQIS